MKIMSTLLSLPQLLFVVLASLGGLVEPLDQDVDCRYPDQQVPADDHVEKTRGVVQKLAILVQLKSGQFAGGPITRLGEVAVTGEVDW